MTLEVSFYQLLKTPLEKALPRLIEKVYSSGLRAVIVCESQAQLESLNSVLWTFSPGAFIPHGFEGEPKRQPIWLSLSDDNPNHANVVVVTNGIVVTNGLFERCIDIFDGNNAQATQSARDRYRDYSAIPGCKLTFWKQDANGNWEK